MNDIEFTNILNKLGKYLAMEKKFTVNPEREAEFKKAIKIACELFHDSKVYTEDDPLQMGAMILCIEDFDISVAGEREINLFNEMTELADNFEIYALDENTVKFAAVFQEVLKRI